MFISSEAFITFNCLDHKRVIVIQKIYTLNVFGGLIVYNFDPLRREGVLQLATLLCPSSNILSSCATKYYKHES